MTYKAKTRFIFEKYPETKLNVGMFAWRCFEEFYGAKFYATKKQIVDFHNNDLAKLNRARKDISKDPNFLTSEKYKEILKENNVKEGDEEQFDEVWKALGKS